MANNSNRQIVNGYTFKIVDGKVVPDIKANLQGMNPTLTTKRVAMEMGRVNTKEEGLSL